MSSKVEKVIERAEELGYTPIAETIICAKFTPYNERTMLEKGVDLLKDSMQMDTPDSYYKILFCTENELVIIPLSWWTGTMKKGEHQAIPFADITAFKAPEAKTISWQGMLTTKDGEYELVISDEKLSKLSLSGGALLKGDWQQNNLPCFISKLGEVAVQ